MKRTDPANPIRNIRLIAPGFLERQGESLSALLLKVVGWLEADDVPYEQ